MQIGQHVLCIDDWWPPFVNSGPEHIILPVKGRVYTVRELLLWGAEEYEDTPCVRLEEIVNNILTYAPPVGESEHAFDRRRFKPLTKIDIKQFTQQMESIR